MPRFAIAINGQKHVFEGPNADAATRFAQQWARDNPQAVNPGQPSGNTLGGYVDTFNRAVPGLSEMGAGLAAGGGLLDDLMAGRPADFGARWSQARAHQQSQIDQLRNSHPIAANMTTGLGLAAPLAAALATGGPAAAPLVVENVPLGLRATAARLAANTARNAFTGAAVGGVYGASQPGPLSQRLSAANQNMLPGAVAGVAAPAVVGATRAGLAGVRALTSDANAIPSALALAGGALQRLPTSEDALYNASVNGIDGVNRAAATRQIPWSVDERLQAIPRTTVAAPDDEYAAADRIRNTRIFKRTSEIADHFQEYARDYMVEPITDDPDFKGYTGFQVSGIRSRLSDLAEHYRPQGKSGMILANEIDQMNADFTAMAGRTQPEFARAMTRLDGKLDPNDPDKMSVKYPFGSSNLISMMEHLPMGDAFDFSDPNFNLRPDPAEKVEEPQFIPAHFMASAVNDDFPLKDEDPEALDSAPTHMADNNPDGSSKVLKMVSYRPLEHQGSMLARAGHEFDATRLMASAANENPNIPLEPPEEAPSVMADPDDHRIDRWAAPTAKMFDLEKYRQAQSGLSPTLEGAAASLVPNRPNAFTGADSDMGLAAAIATRAPRMIDDANFGIPGLNIILPLAAGVRDGADPSTSPREQPSQ